jgi:hypothetical protein
MEQLLLSSEQAGNAFGIWLTTLMTSTPNTAGMSALASARAVAGQDGAADDVDPTVKLAQDTRDDEAGPAVRTRKLSGYVFDVLTTVSPFAAVDYAALDYFMQQVDEGAQMLVDAADPGLVAWAAAMALAGAAYGIARRQMQGAETDPSSLSDYSVAS